MAGVVAYGRWKCSQPSDLMYVHTKFNFVVPPIQDWESGARPHAVRD